MEMKQKYYIQKADNENNFYHTSKPVEHEFFSLDEAKQYAKQIAFLNCISVKLSNNKEMDNNMSGNWRMVIEVEIEKILK